ncbi:helix-turn-helix transcriptional regulator [Streptomyces sp. NPDC015345]|uniref:helix-turn-helix transcriptional regulator n=1 Tax=Streptomyces sp. NPDC015345 TaxID=3364953 RepID=UPI0037008422
MRACAVSVLGLSEVEEELYRCLLRIPGTRADDVPTLVDGPPQEVERALGRLIDLAVVVVGADGGCFPEAPELVVDRLVDLRLQQLHTEMRAVTQARHLVASLRAEQELAPDEAPVVEKIVSLDAMRTKVETLALFAREEILCAEPYIALTHEDIQHARPTDLQCLRRGVRIKKVVLAKALEDPVTSGYLCELVSKGAEVCVVDDMAVRTLVYDRRTALTSVDPADGSRGALVVQEAGLVANIVDLFEKVWADAPRLSEFCGEKARARLPAIEQRVLETMCRGTKDEIGARDLGISVRTYRRYVANILHILEAANRAQAAILARERGWI